MDVTLLTPVFHEGKLFCWITNVLHQYDVGRDDVNQPDRVGRQLCGGRTATVLSAVASCGCGLATPPVFTTNQSGDDTFLATLNGHPLADSCQAAPAAATEAPSSRPTTAGGVPGTGRRQSRDQRRARRPAQFGHARELPAPLADDLHGPAHRHGSPSAGRSDDRLLRTHAPVVQRRD